LLYSYIFIVTFVVASDHHLAFVALIASIPQEVVMQVLVVILHPCPVVAYLVASLEASAVAFPEEAFPVVAYLEVASVVQEQEEQVAQVVEVAQ
jgi:hypothetical protein